MTNRVVARYLDGRTIKGTTADFLPTRPTFHVIPGGQSGTSIQVVDVRMADLKAVFFVKDLTGDAAYNEGKAFASDARAAGRKVQVEFNDGEIIVGTTQGYQPEPTWLLRRAGGSEVEQRSVLRRDGGGEGREVPVAGFNN